MKENKPKFGSVEWIKSLSDESIDTLREFMNNVRCGDGWFADEDFLLEIRIDELDTTIDREHMYRVGIALGIREEKVNKTVGYLKGDIDPTGETQAIDAMERRISIAERDYEEDSQFKTGDGPL